MYKFFQRRTYSFLNTCWGFSLVLILSSLIIISIVSRIGTVSNSSNGLRGTDELFYSKYDFKDNIAQKHVEPWVAYGPIDVVYTWVNGSDPVWLQKKETWAKKNRGEIDSYAFTNDVTNSTDSNSTALSEDDTMSSNRYRDSEELRYSLRSLMQYAPWIRHIYLVTDNQIPNWLNLETSKLSIVTHEEIFANLSHLPVFSSPAIEANIHRIPGLSKKFIYFNDDVFLGRPITPADFVSLQQSIQHFILAWDVPKCAPGCSESWIGDGFCDKACNVSSCNFDFPDCINGTNVPGSPNYQGSSGMGGSSSNQGMNNIIYCSSGCPDSWLHDKICDTRCNNEECGYDLGDCGMDLVYEHYPNSVINAKNSLVYDNGVTPPDKSLEMNQEHESFEEYPYMHDYYMEDEYQQYMEEQQQRQQQQQQQQLQENQEGFDSSTTQNSSSVANITAFVGNDSFTPTPTRTPTLRPYPSDDYGFPYRVISQGHRNNGGNKTAKDTRPEAATPSLQVMYGTKAVYFDISFLPCYVYEQYINPAYPIKVTPFNLDANQMSENTLEPPTLAPTLAPTIAPTSPPVAHNSIPALKTIRIPQHGQYCPLFETIHGEEGEFASIPFEYKTAVTSDANNIIIQHANINSRHHALTVLLYHGQSEVVKPTSYPVDVWFTVTGEWTAAVQDPVTNATTAKVFSSSIQFLLRVEDPNTFAEFGKRLQQGSHNNNTLVPISSQYMHGKIHSSVPATSPGPSVDSNATTQTNGTSESLKPSHDSLDVQILSLPLLSKESNNTNETKEGLIVSLVYSLDHHHPRSDQDHNVVASSLQTPAVVANITLTLFNGTVYQTQYPWRELLLQYQDASHSFSFLHSPLHHQHHSHHHNHHHHHHNKSHAVDMLTVANAAFEEYLHSFFAEYVASFQSTSNSLASGSSTSVVEQTHVTPSDMLVHLRTLRNQFLSHHSQDSLDERKGLLFTIPLPFQSKDIPAQYVSVVVDVIEEADTLFSLSGLFQYGSQEVIVPVVEDVSPQEGLPVPVEVIRPVSVIPAVAVDTLLNEAAVPVVNTSSNTTTKIVDQFRISTDLAAASVEVEEQNEVAPTEVTSSATGGHRYRNYQDDALPADTPTHHHRRHHKRSRRLSHDRTAETSAAATGPANTLWSSLSQSILSVIMPSVDTKEPTSLSKKQTHRTTKAPTKLDPAAIQAWADKVESFFTYADNHYDDLLDHLTTYHMKQQQKSQRAEEDETFAYHRRLVDTYASSLIYVNRLYNKKFGVESRKVPAHVPHMIDTEYMEEMQSIWSNEWQLTSSHRFRHEQDMQYAFAYYFYALNRHKLLLPTNESIPSLDQVLQQEEEGSFSFSLTKKNNTLEYDRTQMITKFIHDFVDHNEDDHIDYNELRTLLILFTQKEYHLIPNETLTSMHTCMNTIMTQLGTRNRTTLSQGTATGSASVNHGLQGSLSPTPSHVVTASLHSSQGHITTQHHHYPYPTIAELLTCPLVTKLYIDHVHPVYTKYYPISTTGNDREIVAFEMISDDMNTTLSQLDSIRLRQNKFICLNDNMKAPSPALVEAVQQFLASMFPVVTSFELPPGQVNPTLYVSEYRARFPSSLGAFATGWKERSAARLEEEQSLAKQLEVLVEQVMSVGQEFVWKPFKQLLINGAYAILDCLEDIQDPQHRHHPDRPRPGMRGNQPKTESENHEIKEEDSVSNQDNSLPQVNTDESAVPPTFTAVQEEQKVQEVVEKVEEEQQPGEGGNFGEEEGIGNGLVQAGLWIMVLGVFALIAIQRQLAHQHHVAQRSPPATPSSSTKVTNNTDGTLPVVIPPTKQFLAPIPKFKGSQGLTASTSSASLSSTPSTTGTATGAPKKGSLNNSQSINQLFGLTGSAKSTTSNPPKPTATTTASRNTKKTPDPAAKLIVVEADYLAQLEASKRQLEQLQQNNKSQGNNNSSPNGGLSAKYKEEQLKDLDRDDYHEALRMMATYDEEDDEPPSTFVPFAAKNNEKVIIRMSQSRLALSDLVPEEQAYDL